MKATLDLKRADRLDVPFWATRLRNALPAETHSQLAREYDFFRRHQLWETNETHEMELAAVGANSLSRLVFGSAAMIEKASKLTGLPLLPFIQLGFHFHPKGTGEGLVHHDYVYIRCGKERPGQLPSMAFAKRAKYARALTLLYYLGNDWANARSDGGTALYTADPGQLKKPFSRADYVPPVNNTALIFECSPNGWHGFTGRSAGERHSIAVWYLAPADAMEKKYGVRPFYYETCVEKTLAYFRSVRGGRGRGHH